MPLMRLAIAVVAATILLFAAACGGSSADRTAEQPPETTQTTAVQEESSSTEETTSAVAATAGPVRVETTVIASGLEVPWGLAFLPDGSALVSKRDSNRLLSVDSSGNVEEVQRLPAGGSGEGGLLGIALSPDYESDGLVYAYYTAKQDNRVVRFRLGENPEPLLTGIPIQSYHNGGRIAFGPDGLLYVGTGDGGEPSNAQDLNSLGGKILRITPDGDAPSDNPFPDSPVYSYGHRNVEGLAWD